MNEETDEVYSEESLLEVSQEVLLSPGEEYGLYRSPYDSINHSQTSNREYEVSDQEPSSTSTFGEPMFDEPEY